MHAIVKGNYFRLSAQVESVLKQLGFKFIVNGGGSVTEYEVQEPCKFIVSVRDASGSSFRFPLIASTKIETIIELRRMVGGEKNQESLRRAAGSLAGALSAQFPKLKWKDSDEMV